MCGDANTDGACNGVYFSASFALHSFAHVNGAIRCFIRRIRIKQRALVRCCASHALALILGRMPSRGLEILGVHFVPCVPGREQCTRIHCPGMRPVMPIALDSFDCENYSRTVN